jgi:hypothetical protein
MQHSATQFAQSARSSVVVKHPTISQS